MDARALIARLERGPDAVEALVAGLSDADWRWRPADGGWSIVEIVNHLVDEETIDFRTRLRMTLEDTSQPWPGMDPEGDVARKGFQDRDPAESLRRFREERAASLAWLRSVADADWSTAHSHFTRGVFHAGDLLASWAAHDARHLQQIAKRLHGLAARDGAPWSVAYAG
jgi:hypothetical protein